MQQKIISDPRNIPQSLGLRMNFGLSGLEILKEVGRDGTQVALCLNWQSKEGRAFVESATATECRMITRSIDFTACMEINDSRSSELRIKNEKNIRLTVKDFMRNKLKDIGKENERNAFVEDHMNALSFIFEGIKERAISKSPELKTGSHMIDMLQGKRIDTAPRTSIRIL